MVRNTVIDRCPIGGFGSLERLDDDKYIFRWGFRQETEQMCSYECAVYRGLLDFAKVNRMLSNATRIPGMNELKSFGEAMALEEEQMVSWMKDFLLKAIMKYDKSKEVEDFTINGVHLWLDGELRNKVRENLEYCREMGLDNTVLRYEGMAFPMSTSMGWQLYYSVLGYARDTWNVTESHRASVKALDTISSLIEYEKSYPITYPSKLAF